MNSKNVKTKVNELLRRIDGPKMTKYAVLAALLHITPRYVINLKDGKVKASYHLAAAIDKLVREK